MTSASTPPELALDAGCPLPAAWFGGEARASSLSVSTPPELSLDAGLPLPAAGFGGGARLGSLSAASPPEVTLEARDPLRAAGRLATGVRAAKARLAFFARSLLPMIGRWPRAGPRAKKSYSGYIISCSWSAQPLAPRADRHAHRARTHTRQRSLPYTRISRCPGHRIV